jgi:transglutaminase-like putative cysteine protease
VSTPIGLLAACLVLWGISVGVPWAGVAVAFAVEGARHLPLARPISERAQARIVRVATLAVLGALAYAAVARNFPHAIYEWLRWLPLVASPFPIAQRLAHGPLPVGGARVDTTYVYAAVVLVAAGAGSGAVAWLYAAYAAIVSWAIVAHRLPGKPRTVLLPLAAAVGLGYAVHVGVAALQGQFEEWGQELLQDFFDPKADPFRERTRIGELGRIKLGDRIVMRVATTAPRPGALLLREAAFDRYRNGEWQSTRRAAQPLAREGDTWRIAPGAPAARLTLRRSMSGGEGLLALPAGARLVARLPAETLERIPTGAVRARGVPRFLAFDAAYERDAAADAAPAAVDLEVPELIAPVLDQVIAAQSLRKESPAATLAAIRAFFDANYAYSLELSSSPTAPPRTLAAFLTTDRKGHCEYFATATVLLARRAGVPARYVGGYSAQEFSPLEDAFVVRARHAHAWSTAYVEGRWVDADTTPSRWAQFEEEEMHGWFGALLDRISYLVERVVRWWTEGADTDWSAAGRLAGAVLATALAIAAGYLAWKRRRRAPRARAPDAIALAWQAVEDSLAATHPRRPGETPREWARRLESEAPAESWRARLAELAGAYYRARFDPGAPPAETARFLAVARGWNPG